MQLNSRRPAAPLHQGFYVALAIALVSECSDCIKYVLGLTPYSVRRTF
jgi:hypothetical protein